MSKTKKFVKSTEPQRIFKFTRHLIIADFWPFEEDKEFAALASLIKPEDFNLHATAMNLYALLLHTGYFEESIDGETEEKYKNEIKLHPKYTKRKLEAYNSLPTRREYAGKTRKELDEIIEEITMRDIRNCFAHGNFEIRYKESVFDAEFVLNPTQSKIVSDEKIYISFKMVYTCLAKLLQEKSQTIMKQEIFKSVEKIVKDKKEGKPVDEELNRKIEKESKGDMMKDIILPVNLLNLVRFYAGQSFDKKILNELKQGVTSAYMANIFLATELTYNQSEYHRIFGKDSSVFKAVSLIRNSLAHNNTEFSADGEKQKLKNEYKNVTTEVESELNELSIKMEILEAQKRLKGYKPEAEEMIGDDFLEKETNYNDLVSLLEESYRNTFGENFDAGISIKNDKEGEKEK